jgi:putative hydrolase of the HAD superfamily
MSAGTLDSQHSILHYTEDCMPASRRHLIWDFDGTLGYRPGQWTGTMAQVLRRFADRDVDLEIVRPFMRKGFPWHNPLQVNPPMRAADDWWEALKPVFEEAFIACQVPRDQAGTLAGKVRCVYTDLAEWRLFEETAEVLKELLEEGWEHTILSNHVPELPSLIAGLGLVPLIRRVVNSAETGFEKPHPRAYHAALTALGDAAEVWMIGDNINADVLGAEAVGLQAILVRSEDPRASRRAESLRDVRGFLGESGLAGRTLPPNGR